MSENNTRSEIGLRPVYGPGDSNGADYTERLGDPGEYPFTRGTRSYTGQGWIQRELSGEGDAKRSNEQFKYLMDLGQTGLDVIGDSPTMSLMDPDHPLARYTVGTQGVSLCAHDDYRQLLEDIPLDQMSISSSTPSMFMVASLYLLAEERGTSPGNLRGSVIEWPFYSEHCSYAYKMPFDLHLRMSCDVIEFCSKEMPRFHGYLEDTYFFSEAGLNAVEEAALGFVEIRHIVRTLVDRGLDIDSFAPRIAILTNCSMDFYEEIAKIRAMRRIFARMMKEEFGAQDPRSQAVNIAVHTSGLSLTTEQPANNIVRGAVQTVALGLAGVSALEISTFDEGYRTPSKEAHLVGLRTQQVIDVESNINSVQDPFGGSWFMESLTDDVEEKILVMVDDIESRGDPAELVSSGFFRQFFHGTMGRYHHQVHDGEVLKVGMNVHQMAPEEDTLLRDISEEKIEPLFDRIEDLKKWRAGRDHEALQTAFQRLHDVVQTDENMMSAVLECTVAGATMGEIAGIMRQAWGVPYDPYGYLESPLGGAQ
ncbi:MAG: methylmalonyl-CoA mutase family protein [Actinomycetota bacterium]|nr:methylmalonyl-CoA mutase family protein [Actinomycetota bacterium]